MKVLLILLISFNAQAACFYNVSIEPHQAYDGDTIQDVKITLPFDISVTKTLRLLGVDAHELHGTEKELGIKARDWLRNKMATCSRHRIRITGTDSFGRGLAILYCGRVNINELMIKEGMASRWVK